LLRWLKRKLRPPLPEGEPYRTNPTPGNLYALIKKRCPVCGLSPPDWAEGHWALDHDGPPTDDAVCGRCAAHFRVDQKQKVAVRLNRMR
jgi:hypothetical protein